jgi:hypothetical protein
MDCVSTVRPSASVWLWLVRAGFTPADELGAELVLDDEVASSLSLLLCAAANIQDCIKKIANSNAIKEVKFAALSVFIDSSQS